MKTNSRRGVTLAELMVAMTLSALILSAVMGTFLFIVRSSVRITNYYEMERQTSAGLELLARDLRMATTIDTSANQVSLNKGSIVYSYNSTAATFTRTTGGKTRILVSNIEPGTFEFTNFDLNHSTAVSDYDTRQMQITMTIRPDNRGLVAATSKRVISSRFVLRNR